MTGVTIRSLDDAKNAVTILHEKGIKTVLIALGKDGVCYSDEDAEKLYPWFSAPVVDTTGAGDAFNGAFTVALISGDYRASY